MSTSSPEPSIQALLPSLTPEDARRAEENVEAYLALVIRVYSRIRQDPQALAELRAALRKSDAFMSDETLTV